MRAREIMETSAGSTSSGAIAPSGNGLGGGVLSRGGGSLLTGKYVTDADPTPNTPKEYKRNKHARGQFKNTPGN